MFISNHIKYFKSAVLLSAALLTFNSCKNQKSIHSESAQVWLTKANQTVKLQKQNSLVFSSKGNDNATIEIDASQKFQSIDGFGYTLTGGSVEVINTLNVTQRKALLQELFGNSEKDIRVNYIRLSIGASDLNGDVFTYNDLPKGEKDLELKKFSLEKDRAVIEMLKDILKINPSIKIIATPWTPPVWMKDNENSIGGTLKTEFYNVYARYFVKYIQEMKKEGIVIDAITPQNEPLHPGNNPSLLMTAEEQREFIKKELGPEFVKNKLKTKIVLYDHNCNKPEYPISILDDPEAKQYIDGSAFHLYQGEISALSTVHNAHPDKNLYFTEQWTGSKGEFAGDLMWHVKNVIIGSMRNWSKNALEWNLANDEVFQPHTPGGCTECKGALTISKNGTIERNVAYYIIAHASKFVPQNSHRIASTQPGSLSSVAFARPDGKIALIVLNDGNNTENFNIKYNNKTATTAITPKTVATFVF